MKWFLLAVGMTFLPVWKDDMTDRGLNLWEYIHMAEARKHIPAEEAIINYRRNYEKGSSIDWAFSF